MSYVNKSRRFGVIYTKETKTFVYVFFPVYVSVYVCDACTNHFVSESFLQGNFLRMEILYGFF